jgi:flagellar basal-body rod protein FlgC
MSGFDTFDVARSGLTLSKTWLDVVSNNIANVNTVHPAGQQPFRAAYLVAREVGSTGGARQGSGGGVAVVGTVVDNSQPAVVSDPGNPMADARGDVTEPVVDLEAQMTDMIMANRSFQANERSVETARDMYTAALRIGR